ncbi:MAG: ABC transporter permease subunit [Deltaproteobacteria bacterium]|nr:ABC transporter permease subunit [Deltaproteobacteria bacterium]
MRFRSLLITISFAVLGLYGVLILSLFYFFSPSHFLSTLFSQRVLFSIRLSLLAATMATFLSVALAIPSAYAISRFRFKGKDLVDTILELPMIVSPAALGAMILIFFNTPVGDFLQQSGFRFIFALPGIILAQFMTTVGIATRLIKTALDEIPVRYENVARSLGVSPQVAFLTITLPLAKKGIIASSILTWAKALGEFGATITVAGSMAMRTETIPIALFMRLSNADIEGTVLLIFILIVTGLGILYLSRLLLKNTYHA